MSFSLTNCKKEEPPKVNYEIFVRGGDIDNEIIIDYPGGTHGGPAVRNGVKLYLHTGQVVYWRGYSLNNSDTVHLVAIDSSKNKVFFDADIIFQQDKPVPSGKFFIE